MRGNHENVDIEYKRMYVPELRKDIVAFANTGGGKLYIGVNDDGTIIGIGDTDDTMLRLAGSLKDSIAPDIMPFVQIRAVDECGKNVIAVEVASGSAKPYYLKDKGLKPNGVYVRRGSSSQPLSEAGIRDMIVEYYGKSYETVRSLKQNLTFTAFQKELAERHLSFGEAQMRTLNLIGEDGLYTNLALLLSDQCEHTLKIAIFQGTDDVVFRNHQEFTGSLLSQLKEGFAFLDKNIAVKSSIDGLRRKDERDYPMAAVREALLNAIIHRDYGFNGSTIINIYDDRIEFISLGGLVSGLSMDAILMGVSQSRNAGLANVFFRLKLVESYGTGIKRIQALYKGSPKQAVFESATGAFKTTIYNLNEPGISEKMSLYQPNNEKEIILNLAIKQKSITRKDVEIALSIGSTKAYSLLTDLCNKGILIMQKAGNRTCYLPQ
ncbi:RNA-binding domain-containing protein [Selenomonas ruminantium]|uniref:RNA-binding domain-containing protein n=1 Tax=Selenomonas ruminantium TaxID=971 RepID=UPI0026F1EFAD|nr:RNA-binding domain-containing protein [Selenomonas ruminantium]